MKIGIFYNSVEDYRLGKSSRIGVIDECDRFVEDLPINVKLRVENNEIYFSEFYNGASESELKELIPEIALETADICDMCGEQGYCECIPSEQSRRK